VASPRVVCGVRRAYALPLACDEACGLRDSDSGLPRAPCPAPYDVHSQELAAVGRAAKLTRDKWRQG
jgi:hypothetical protein